MTTERWNDEKLDRLADIVSGIAIEIQDLTRKLNETTNIANSNAPVVQAMADAIAEAATERREILRVIAQQQSEIRGLQTENYRMWEFLTNQRNQDDNPDT